MPTRITPASTPPDLEPRQYPSRTASRMRAAQRRSELGRLVHLGLSQEELAARLGVSPAQIHYDLRSLREQWYKETFAETNQSVARDCALLSYSVQCLMPSIQAGNAKSVEAAAKCIELRAKLMGVLVGGHVTIDVERYVRRIAEDNGYDGDEAIMLAERIAVSLR